MADPNRKRPGPKRHLPEIYATGDPTGEPKFDHAPEPEDAPTGMPAACPTPAWCATHSGPCAGDGHCRYETEKNWPERPAVKEAI